MQNNSTVSYPYTHTNKAGAPSFRRPPKEELVRVLTCGTGGNTYYASGQEVQDSAMQVIKWFAKTDPRFLAQALIYAREKGLMRDLPARGLAVLSGASRVYFEAAFNRVVRIPSDLITFVEMVRSGSATGKKSFGGCRVKAVADWFTGLSEYHAIKYAAHTVEKDRLNLRKILQLSHPKAEDAATFERLGWVARGWRWIGEHPSPTNPKIWALERLKRTVDEAEVIRLVTEFGLPFESVVPAVSKMTPGIWEALLKNAPYFNLLRMLNTFQKNGLFKNPELVEYVAKFLADPGRVKRSKLFPFRFKSAHEAYTREEGYSRKIAEAITTALDLSFACMPDFPHGTKVCVSPDVSGSMGGMLGGSWRNPAAVGSYTYVDIAGIIAGALAKKAGSDCLVLPVDTRLHHPQFSVTDSLMTIARHIAGFGGGGTSLSLPVEHLLDRKVKVDVYIGITDSEEWAYGHGYYARSSWYNAWQEYRRVVNPKAQAVVITLDPGSSAVAPVWDDSVHFVYGWSESVISFIPLAMQDGASQLAAVEAIEMPD